MLAAPSTTWSMNENEVGARFAEVGESGLTAKLYRGSDNRYQLEVQLPSLSEALAYHSVDGCDDDQALVWAQDILDRLQSF